MQNRLKNTFNVVDIDPKELEKISIWKKHTDKRVILSYFMIDSVKSDFLS